MSEELTLAARILLDAKNYLRGLGHAESETKKFTGKVGEQFKRAGEGMLRAMEVHIGAIGAGIIAVHKITESANLDKSLIRLGQTAGLSMEQIAGVRKELWGMSRETGQQIDDLTGSLNMLVEGGMTNMKEALPSLDAINKTMAVTGSAAESLASSLEIAAHQFDFDLTKPKQALQILDEMTAANRNGRGFIGPDKLGLVLQNRVAVNARAANFNFKETLAFIEQLSKYDNDPSQLATMTNYTMQLFARNKQLLQAQTETGVQFFDRAGAKRDPLTVLSEVKSKMDAIKTDRDKETWLASVFKGVPIRSLIGLRLALAGNNLAEMRKSAAIDDTGTVQRNAAKALDNAQDQTLRLKAVFGTVADRIAQPVNKLLAGGIEKLISPKSQGGLDLSGGELIAALGGIGAGGALLKRFGGGIFNKLGANPVDIMQGKVLEQVSGVTPVFVVNMPGGGGMPGVAADAVTTAAEGGGAVAAASKWRLLMGLPGLIGAAIASPTGAKEKYDVLQGTILGAEGRAARGEKQNLSVDLTVALAKEFAPFLKMISPADKPKAELHITIDSAGNARVNKMSLGDAFSNITTALRNSPGGRMMTAPN